jgi:hypothetical protein
MNSINDNVIYWHSYAPYSYIKQLPYQGYSPDIKAQSGENKRNMTGTFTEYGYGHDYIAPYYRQVFPFSSNHSSLKNNREP